MCYSAIAIANYFIQKGKDFAVPLSNMHLQKMVFFAHAAYFNETDKPLIVDPVMAWLHGPVIESLYHELKRYGRENITELITTVVPCQKDKPFPCKLVIPEVRMNDMETVCFLNRAWSTLACVETWKLRKLSHEEGGAWYTTVFEYAKSQGETIDPKDDSAVEKLLPRNLVILDPVIKRCGR